MDAEIVERQPVGAAQRKLLTRRLAEASDRTRKQLNGTLFEHLEASGGRLSHQQYRPPFDDIFSVSEFEYGTRVGRRRSYSNGMKRGLPR